MRKLAPGKLVIASHNEGKVREIRTLLAPFGIEPVSAASLDLPEPEETGTTFVANAMIKAQSAADLSGLPALADDSGLCVEALNGEPGVYTANWAELVPGDSSRRDWMHAMRTVEDRLQALGPNVSRSAHFTCTLALVWPDGSVYREFLGRDADGTSVAGATRIRSGRDGSTIVALYRTTPERWGVERARAQALLAAVDQVQVVGLRRLVRW